MGSGYRFSSEAEFKAQRLYQRKKLRSIARVFPEGERGGIEAFVKDISRRGLGFYTKSLLEVNREVTARLQFTNHFGNTTIESVTGRVVWSDPWEDAFSIGVEFKEVIHPDKNPGLYAHTVDGETFDP